MIFAVAAAGHLDGAHGSGVGVVGGGVEGVDGLGELWPAVAAALDEFDLGEQIIYVVMVVIISSLAFSFFNFQ